MVPVLTVIMAMMEMALIFIKEPLVTLAWIIIRTSPMPVTKKTEKFALPFNDILTLLCVLHL